MIWKHYYSLLASTAVIITLIATRPDFDGWYLLPLLLAGGGGTTIIIQLGRRRLQTPMLDKVDEELEAKKRVWELNKKILSDGVPSMRPMMGAVILVLGGIMAYAYLSEPGAIDNVKEWMGLFGCSC